MANICVIGAGYVGLITATCFADMGHRVVCLDNDEAKVAGLQIGAVPVHEPGLSALLTRVLASQAITFTTRYDEAIPVAEFVFIAVDTPSGVSGHADLMSLRRAINAAGPLLRPDSIVVNKSTVPIGTGDLVSLLLSKTALAPFSVVSNPEFLREGSAIADFMQPDRLVFGSASSDAAARVAALYMDMDCPTLLTDIRTAEMIKYASNAYLATKISFINEMAAICEHLGADVKEVARGMGYDQRIGPKFLSAGLGWGGSCFPKDVSALVHMAQASGSHPQLLQAVLDINRGQRLAVLRKLTDIFGSLEDLKIGLLGLSFKPDTDDVRNSPALELALLLELEGCRVGAYDPVAMDKAHSVMPDLALAASAYELAEGVDALIVATEWPEFSALDYGRIRESMRTPVVIDGRNLLDPAQMRSSGFLYVGTGRGGRDGTPNGERLRFERGAFVSPG